MNDIKEKREPLDALLNDTFSTNKLEFNQDVVGYDDDEINREIFASIYDVIVEDRTDYPYCEADRANERSNLEAHNYRNKGRRPYKLNRERVAKCDHCGYKTTRKNYMLLHLLKHKRPDELEMLKCNECSFQTKYKNTLRVHLRIHDPNGRRVFKCDQCDYKTQYRRHLNTHQLKHKSPDEVEMFECDLCEYRTKYKSDLTVHLKSHDPNRPKIFGCNQCGYKTPYRGHLKTHMLRHANPAQMEMLKCEQCGFQTKYNNALAKHVKRHIDRDVLYGCESCDFKALSKRTLKVHSLSHQKA